MEAAELICADLGGILIVTSGKKTKTLEHAGYQGVISAGWAGNIAFSIQPVAVGVAVPFEDGG